MSRTASAAGALSPSLCALHDVGACGSCPALRIALPDQLAAKQERVAQALHPQLAPEVWLTPYGSSPTHFRNKAKMAVAGSANAPTLGILDRHGAGIDLRDCPLHVPAIHAALPHLAAFIRELQLTPYDVAQRRGELKYVLVTASPDEDLMVRFVLRSARHLPDIRAALPDLERRLPQLAVASVNIQPVHQAVIEGAQEIVLTAQSRLLMRLTLPATVEAVRLLDAGQPTSAVARELPLYLPTQSFFQTNTQVAQALYATARAWVEEAAPASVWDLFCGVGGFALATSAPERQVLGMEVSAPAIEGARDAAALMGADPALVRFEAGDARVLDPARGQAPDVLVVNPPRRGIGPELAERIERSTVPRVLYSSCNPETLARDLAFLPSLRAVRARLFDMFPHTDHAEVLVELRRT